jgi:uncharacterized membrane protein YphA (DoxX/SURF4 family)
MMNIVLWIGQVLLAVIFVGVGIMHAFQYDRIAERLKWPAAVGRQRMFLIGVCEMLGAAGVILPALTGILPWLTPVAASALALLMIFAAIFHIRRSERYSRHIVIIVLAAFVAFGRFVLSPIG